MQNQTLYLISPARILLYDYHKITYISMHNYIPNWPKHIFTIYSYFFLNNANLKGFYTSYFIIVILFRKKPTFEQNSTNYG